MAHPYGTRIVSFSLPKAADARPILCFTSEEDPGTTDPRKVFFNIPTTLLSI